MNRRLTLIVMAGVFTLSTMGVLAANRDGTRDRKRDGSGGNCALEGSAVCPNGGTGERKRDGSGSGCGKRNGKRNGSGGGTGERKRDGSGGGGGDGSCIAQ